MCGGAPPRDCLSAKPYVFFFRGCGCLHLELLDMLPLYRLFSPNEAPLTRVALGIDVDD